VKTHSWLTLTNLLSQHSCYRSNHPGLIFGERIWNFADLNQAANQLANALLRTGLKKGDRFATVLPNCPELILAYLAAAASGLVIVPLSVLLQKSGLQTLLNNSGAKLVICGESQVDDIEQIYHELPHILVNGRITASTKDQPTNGWQRYSDFVTSHALVAPEVEIHPDDIYNIMYSSGTTGMPKGIVHTHQIRSLYCTLFANAWRMTPESVVLHAGSIVFNGAMLTLMPWMYLGCKYILHPNFHAEKVISDIEQHRVSHLVMVPAQIIAILQSDAYHPDKLSSVEMLHNVGAPLHLHYKNQINEQLPGRYYELYGVTEGFMTILDKTESTTKTGSVGKPAAFNQVTILKEDGTNCGVNEVGEICGTGPLVMPGYYNRPDLTEAAFHERWLRSGDLGYLDEDGYVFLVDRAKDMIISGGVNVYPRDIEEIVITHPTVTEVAVFGINDEQWGERPVAAVTVSDDCNEETILQWVNERVHAKFQRLSKVVILRDFPRNVAGKILKRELRAAYQTG